MSEPLTTGKTVAAFAWSATMQSAISGASIEKVLPRRPVIRATVVWKPPALSSQIATPAPDREARGVLDRDLLLAEVAVEGQRRDGRVGLAEDRLALAAADRDVGAQVERVAHQVLALADLDDARRPGPRRNRRPPGAPGCRPR